MVRGGGSTKRACRPAARVPPSQRALAPLAVLAPLALLLAAPAAGEEPRPAPQLGLQLDAGLPDGIVAALVYRPLALLRLDAGLSYNLIGFGLRGGATLVPWRLAVSPSLRGELGHTFASDASGFVGSFTSLTAAQKRALSKFGYDYASLQLGVELGDPDRLAFFLRGGIAWVWATAQGVLAVAQEQDPRISALTDPSVRARSLCASAGVLLFW